MSARPGYPPLRARTQLWPYELEILLREHRVLSEEGFLEASALELPGGPGLAGQTLGAYTLVFADRPWGNGHGLAGRTKRRAI